MKCLSWIVSTSLLSQILTARLPAGPFFNNPFAPSKKSSSNSTSHSNSQENSPTTQTNIRGQLQPTSSRAPVDSGFNIDGSFLYWNAKSNGFNYAHKVQLDSSPGSGSMPSHIEETSKALCPKFDSWDPGLQLGIGYIFPQREQWSTRLSWTHLNNLNNGFIS